jgi:hypothetical protein
MGPFGFEGAGLFPRGILSAVARSRLVATVASRSPESGHEAELPRDGDGDGGGEREHEAERL